MNLALIILLLSIISVLVIFGVRLYEFHSGKLLVPHGIRSAIEKKVTDFYKRIVNKTINFIQKTRVFLKEFPTIMAHIMHFYWRKFSKRVDQFFLKLRNKK